MSQAYDLIAEQLLAMTDDAGNWKPAWHQPGLRTPFNGCTETTYRGANILSLWVAGIAHGFTSSRWATYRQWAAAGGQVRKGEKGTPIVYYGTMSRGDGDDERRMRFARTSWVFNANQVDGLPAVPVLELNRSDRNIVAENFLTPIFRVADVRHDPECQVPMYVHGPGVDQVRMPPFAHFHDEVAYYGTLLHELTHWTGHPSREARDMAKRDDPDHATKYAFEELVAELGSAFLCAHLSLEPEPRPDHAQYLAHWHKMLKHDVPTFMRAASLARAAAERLTAIATPMEKAA